ncbi:MAG: hypothetical protein ACU0DI_16395 [Paracoccaceae bacterium]
MVPLVAPPAWHNWLLYCSSGPIGRRYTAPAFLLPLLAGIIAAVFGLVVVFLISMTAAIMQSLILRQIGKHPSTFL